MCVRDLKEDFATVFNRSMTVVDSIVLVLLFSWSLLLVVLVVIVVSG